MPAQSLRQLAKIGIFAFIGLAFALPSPARADLHSMVQEAHQDLQKALNPGGDPPPDDQRIKLIKSALATLKDLPHIRREHPRIVAMDYLKSALDEIQNGDPNHQASKDIYEADSIIRDFETDS